jgi:hypothetical protein
MKPTERLPFTQWADINRTDRFIAVEPKSGYRRALPENEARVIYLPPNASDEVLGRALLEALDRSRFIWPADEPEFFERERFTQCSRNWQKDFMERYGYKTKRRPTTVWIGVGRRGRRGRFPSNRISATSQSILETFRQIEQSSFQRRMVRLQPARRCAWRWTVASSCGAKRIARRFNGRCCLRIAVDYRHASLATRLGRRTVLTLPLLPPPQKN